MESISSYQLLVLTVLYQIGTTVIFAFGSSAGRAAWISVLISTVVGVFIISIYLLLRKLNPGLTLVEWYPRHFGKWIGTPISWMYALQFIYVGGRIIGDLMSLVPNTILTRTPPVVYLSLLLLVVAYGLFGGIEIIARLGELFLPFLFLIILVDIIFILGSDVIYFQYMKPILGKGWSNILNTVWPLGITQTFGQSIEFAMIWPLVKEQNKIAKFTILATIISGVFIATLDFFAVFALGESTFSRSIFPVYRLVRLINIGDFLENLDAFSVLLYLATAFFKISMHIYAAIRSIQILTYSKSNKVFIFPVIILVLYVGMNMASNVSEHIYAGLIILPYNLWILLFFILPILLLLVTLIKLSFKKFHLI